MEKSIILGFVYIGNRTAIQCGRLTVYIPAGEIFSDLGIHWSEGFNFGVERPKKGRHYI